MKLKLFLIRGILLIKMRVLLLFLLSYLLGSIPFGVIVSKFFNVDIQKVGSKNIGATNVFRVLGPLPGSFVFLADLLKGYLSCFIMSYYYPNNYWFIVIAALLVLIGHSHSIFLEGKGGKGAATGLGVLFFISYKITILVIFSFLIIVLLTRYVSVATSIMVILIPILFLWTRQPFPYLMISLSAGFFILFKHIPNFKRLQKGEENKI